MRLLEAVYRAMACTANTGWVILRTCKTCQGKQVNLSPPIQIIRIFSGQKASVFYHDFAGFTPDLRNPGITMRTMLLAGLLAAAGASAAVEPRLRDFREPLGPGANVIGMRCDQAAGTLELAYFDPSSPPLKPMALWLASDLVGVDRETMVVNEIRTLERSCTLGANVYRVVFEAVPGNVAVNSLCGAVTYANAKVWKNGRQVYDEDFERCGGTEAVRSVTFANGADIPQVRKDKLQ